FSAVSFAYETHPSYVLKPARVGTPVSIDLSTYYVKSTALGCRVEYSFSGGKTGEFSLSKRGELTGTPTTAGPFTFSVIAFDTYTGKGHKRSDCGSVAQFTLTVQDNSFVPSKLTCGDGSNAFRVGSSEDKKFDIFLCPR